METKKRAKRLIKKLGNQFGPDENFIGIIETIQNDDLKKYIVHNVKRYQKLFLRYSSRSRKINPLTVRKEALEMDRIENNKELCSKIPGHQQRDASVKAKKTHSKMNVTADEAVQNGHTNDLTEEENKYKKEAVEPKYCYNLYKRGKKMGLDSIPSRFYGHVLPLLLHKDQNIWHQVQGEAKQRLFLKTLQHSAGDKDVLESLMKIFVQVICDDTEPISAAELSQFMNFFTVKKIFQSEELSCRQYGDLMAAIVAVYIDQVAVESRNAAKVKKITKKLTRRVNQLLLVAESPMIIVDCLVQCEKLTENDAVLVTPLFRRAFQILKKQAKLTPPQYAKALCLNYEVQRIFKASAIIFQENFRSIAIPETFQNWLNKRGIREYYIDTDQPAAFIAALMEALVEPVHIAQAQADDSSEDIVDTASKVQTEEADLFFIDPTGAKDVFPEMAEERVPSSSDEENDEDKAKQSHCSTVVAETLKIIRELTEKERLAANYKEMRPTSADFFDDSDVEVHCYSHTPSTGQDPEKKGKHVSKSDGEVEKQTTDKKRSRDSCVEVGVVEKHTTNKGQSDSDGKGTPEKEKHLKEKNKTRSSKRGKGVFGARKSDDERGSVILMNLVDMFSPEVTGKNDTGSVQTEVDVYIDSDVALPDSGLLPVGSDLDELNPDHSSKKTPSKKETAIEKDLVKTVSAKADLKKGTLKQSLNEDAAQSVTSPRKSPKKSKAPPAEMDDCQIVSSPKKRRLEEQPKFGKASSPGKTPHSEKLQQDRQPTRSSACDGDAASPALSPRTPRRRTRSETVHSSSSSTMKSPLKEVDIESEVCEVSDNKLKFNLPTGSIIIEEMDEDMNPVDDDDWEQVIDEPCLVSASKKETKSKKKTTSDAKKTSLYDFHGSSSEEEGWNTCATLSPKSPCCSPQSMTKIKSKSVVAISGDEISKAETSSKATGSPQINKKSRTRARACVQSKTLAVTIEEDESVCPETPICVPDSKVKTPTESKSSTKNKAVKELAESVHSTPKGKSVQPDTPKPELKAVKELAESVQSTPKGKSVQPGSPKSVRKAVKEHAESVHSTPKGKSVQPGSPKSVRKAVKELAESVHSTPKVKSVQPDTPKPELKAVKELAESVQSTPKGKSVQPGSPKSVRKAVIELAESVHSTPKGKSVQPGSPKSVRKAVKELAESVHSTPKGKSVQPGSPKSVRKAVKELAESVHSTPKGKSVQQGSPKSVRKAVKELAESVHSTHKGKSAPLATPKSMRGAVKELAVLKQCAMTDFFTASPLSPEESRRRYSLRYKPEQDDAQSSIFNQSATPVSDADIFGTPQAAVTYSKKKRRVSEIPRTSSDFTQLASPAAKRRLSSINTNPGTPSKSSYDLRH